MSDNNAAFVGNIPEHYDRGLGPHIFDDYAEDIAKRAAALNPDTVLELAAGTGIVSRKLRDALEPHAMLMATDLNPPMLDIAKAKFKADEKVSFSMADAMALNEKDGALDLIVSQFGVMFFPDKPASFREALRVLKPGGHYLFNVWGDMSANPFAQVAFDMGVKHFPDDPPLFYKVPFGYFDVPMIEEELKGAGFVDVSHEVIKLEKYVTDFKLFATGLVFGNPMIEEIKNQAVITPDAYRDELEAALRKKFGPEPAIMPLEAIVFKGRKA